MQDLLTEKMDLPEKEQMEGSTRAGADDLFREAAAVPASFGDPDVDKARVTVAQHSSTLAVQRVANLERV